MDNKTKKGQMRKEAKKDYPGKGGTGMNSGSKPMPKDDAKGRTKKAQKSKNPEGPYKP